MATSYFSLGSNKGNRLENLTSAIKLINNKIGKITKVSNIWESASWNYSDNDYLNLVIQVKTELLPEDILKITQEIERKLGRSRKTTFYNGKAKYSSRTIDIDILFYENDVINTPKLKIPHPNLHLRMFVLKPFMQINSNFIHPTLKKSIKVLLSECEDNGKISIFKKDFEESLFLEP